LSGKGYFGQWQTDKGAISEFDLVFRSDRSRWMPYRLTGLVDSAGLVRDEGVAGSNPATPTST
jgi:hypothetical protein